MGQKVSPHGFRVGVIKDWDSKWYANKKNFSDYLVEDNKVRDFVKKKLYLAGVSKVVIERAAENQMRINVLTAKPGMVIGRGGDGIDQLKNELEKFTGKSVVLNIVELRRPETDAQLTAESIAQALEKRVSFRRAMKQATFLFTPCAPTSTTVSPKPIPSTAASASRYGSTTVKSSKRASSPPSPKRRKTSAAKAAEATDVREETAIVPEENAAKAEEAAVSRKSPSRSTRIRESAPLSPLPHPL